MIHRRGLLSLIFAPFMARLKPARMLPNFRQMDLNLRRLLLVGVVPLKAIRRQEAAELEAIVRKAFGKEVRFRIDPRKVRAYWRQERA